VRKTEEMLAERQTQFMEKQREANEKNELVRRTEEILPELRHRLLKK
jgi:hypothetical protein